MSYRGARGLIYSIINGKFPYLLLGVLLGVIVFEGLHILFLLFVLPRFGLECDKITVKFFSFKRVNGRWQKGDQPYTPFVRYTVTDKGSTDVTASHTHFIICRLIAKAVLSAIVTILSLPAWSAALSDAPPDELSFNPDTDWAIFVVFFCIISWSAVIGDVIALISHAGSPKDTLGGYVQKIKTAVKNGADITSMNLPPLNELEFPDEPSAVDTLAYLYYYSVSLIMRGDEQKLSEPMHKMTDMLRSEDFLANCINSYGLLIYYYSWLETDEEYARKFYDKAGTALATDTGAGSKRALAYYSYAVLHDVNKARYYLDKARRIAYETENRLEPGLINELDEILKSEGA